jgi:hypothetical protein
MAMLSGLMPQINGIFYNPAKKMVKIMGFFNMDYRSEDIATSFFLWPFNRLSLPVLLILQPFSLSIFRTGIQVHSPVSKSQSPDKPCILGQSFCSPHRQYSPGLPLGKQATGM